MSDVSNDESNDDIRPDTSTEWSDPIQQLRDGLDTDADRLFY